MLNLLTTQQVAEKYDLTAERILQLAKLRGIEPAMVAGRSKLWTPGDADRLGPEPRPAVYAKRKKAAGGKRRTGRTGRGNSK